MLLFGARMLQIVCSNFVWVSLKRNAVLLNLWMQKSYSSGSGKLKINICQHEKETAGPQASDVIDVLAGELTFHSFQHLHSSTRLKMMPKIFTTQKIFISLIVSEPENVLTSKKFSLVTTRTPFHRTQSLCCTSTILPPDIRLLQINYTCKFFCVHTLDFYWEGYLRFLYRSKSAALLLKQVDGLIKGTVRLQSKTWKKQLHCV